MKFGKELASQMVQEWQTAYMDYNHLKKILKDLMIFRQQKSLSSSPGPPARSGSLKRRLTMYRAFSGLTGLRGSPKKNEDEVILVSAVQHEGSENYYQTMFLRSSEEGGQYELEFFRRLDFEFNKVLKFYEGKVEEVKMEADELSKQMDALIALRIRVDKPCVEQDNGNSGPATVIASVNGVKQGARMDVIQEVEMSGESAFIGAEKNKKDAGNFRPASLEVLDHVKINVDPDTPVSTLRNLIKSSKSDLSFSKEELRKAEAKLQQAFIEFYQQLRLLKSYCFLNMLAFSKIMKKYDKITSRSASKAYLEMVDKSYLGTSDEVNKLIERLEATFIKHFANGNRRKGIKSLKPGHKKERHRTTSIYRLLSSTDCCYCCHRARRDLLNHEDVMLTWRIYFHSTGFREIFLLASGLSVLALAAVLSNLDMQMDPRTESFKTLTELVPLGLVTITLPDFFLADQLTSQVQAFRCVQFYVCYYGWGDFKRRSNRCLDSDVYQILYIVVAIVPFWSRFLQCLRRLFEEKEPMQGLNSLKYFSTIVALVMRTVYDLRRGTFWRIMAASTSGVTTVYNTYWDIVIDWGLLQRKARNPWLRDKLLISNKAVYFIVNILLRLVWMQLVLDFNEAPFLHRRAMVAVVACLEILRRGIWNFFRLENEHFNNVGKYRAFKSVPLPFHYEDEKIM
ncbi:hypothetical protein DH2020_037075 [Rehmannia glutinosa]|uniref:Uncharacterized protein n=1 Tax=Rehmannia glutinosa TaxID=99300 RepID=A0ABR0V4E1_REHGL